MKLFQYRWSLIETSHFTTKMKLFSKFQIALTNLSSGRFGVTSASGDGSQTVEPSARLLYHWSINNF